MKHLFTLIVLGLTTVVNAQVRTYYQEYSVLKPVRPFSYTNETIADFTGMPIAPVRTQLKSYFEEKLRYERNGSKLTKINDSIVQYRERYIERSDIAINPEKDFLDVVYSLYIANTDSVIEEVVMTGSEDMLGDVYKRYWKSEINLLENSEKATLASTSHNQDSVLLLQKLPATNLMVAREYSIIVRDKNANIRSTLYETKRLLIKANEEKVAFAKKRRSTTFNLQKEASAKYTTYQKQVEEFVLANLMNQTNISGFVEIILTNDTLGRTLVQVLGKNSRMNNELLDDMSRFTYENHFENGFRMTTVDTFKFEFSAIHELVDLRKSLAGVRLRSTNVPEVEALARKTVMAADVKKADMKCDVHYVVLNGKTIPETRITRIEPKMTGLQVVGGILLAILGIISAIGEE